MTTVTSNQTRRSRTQGVRWDQDLGPLYDREEFRRQLLAMHFQWFGAEDEGRTEDPTEHKIRKAREEGRVAKSQDLASVVVLLFTAIALLVLGPGILTASADMVRFWLVQSTQLDPAHDTTIMVAFMNQFAKLILPISAIGLAAAILGNLVQVGFLFSTKPLKPDFKRIMPNFPQYFKRTLFSVEAIYNLLKALIKMALVILVTAANVIAGLPQLLNLPKKTFMEGFGYVASMTMQVVVESAIILLFLALFDYWFQRRLHREALKMTPQEIKQERKEYDGDPLIKGRMRQRMRQILSQNMMQNLPKADVVVTNPTHFAVALEYKLGQMAAPEVIAKGADAIALRIRELAKEYEIPIIENKPLARALYSEVDVGSAIPAKFYEAVVVVMKQVLRMKKRQREAV